MRVLRSRLQYPRSKWHYVRPLLRRSSRKIADEALEHQAEIEAETRVEEGDSHRVEKPG